MYLSNRKKGFTLYELTIVLAIIAIVSTLVVSFVTFLTNYSNSVKEDNNAMTEIYTYKVMVEKWFSHFDTAEYKFTIDNISNCLIADGTTDYKVFLSDGYITLQYDTESGYGSAASGGSYNELQLTASSITSLTFTNYDNLWRCTVGCDSGDVTFLLERHVVSPQ